MLSWNPRQSLLDYLASCFSRSRAEAEAGFVSTGLAARVAAYTGLTALIVFPRSALLGLAATAAWVVHVGPYLRRVWRTRKATPDRLPVRVLATAIVVVGADIGWLAGHPVGLLKGCWNSRVRTQDRHRGDPVRAFTAATPIAGPAAGRHRQARSS
jgi:hypothetical protein